jgi:putative heme iron utilization protein
MLVADCGATMKRERSVDTTVPQDQGFIARCLLRAARAGTLATLAPDQIPFASLVTPAITADGAVLMLLSGLAAHTKHLRAHPACALMVTGAADGPNPQTTPRITLTGQAAPEPDPAWRRYWLDHHPYAALYADFTDFALWRLAPMAAHMVGGFANAATLTQADLLPAVAHVHALADAASRIITHCNNDHADALNLLAQRPGEWRMLSVDCDGFDMTSGDDVLRVAFDGPVTDASGVRAALVRMVRAAES